MSIAICVLLGLLVLIVGGGLVFGVLGALTFGFIYLLEIWSLKRFFQWIVLIGMSLLLLFQAYKTGCEIRHNGWSVLWRAQ
jgi:predicted tellurium resistance membrane protein TerC